MIIGIFPSIGSANSNKILSNGQSVYVPVYSHIYYGDQERTFNLTTTLSIRNTNLKKDVMLHSIDYFDSNGELLKNYLEAPIVLKKFSTIRYVIKATDKRGGSGAKFIVRWKSKDLSNAPLIEAIMISTQSQQGISFVSRGQAIHE
ncbi:MAG: DUF3124 domain-containing protein [Proteobacteria bacterium]|nr:DUF3124 domain-containing protein [Pseudomonadota bacterium]MBU1581117.1 DUF3124 domain-containing protein [Pseudomonadota bacterium]MBU2628713.1 DUF3124 domain-containing protein [Pseudomonadota bacterium]